LCGGWSGSSAIRSGPAIGALTDRHGGLFAAELDVSPAQTANFAGAQAGERGETDQGEGLA